MALGKSSIADARASLATIRTNLDNAELSNKDFMKIFDDSNFQKFVSETNKGQTLNEQLKSLSDWITSMCSTVETLSSATESYLAAQESLNE